MRRTFINRLTPLDAAHFNLINHGNSYVARYITSSPSKGFDNQSLLHAPLLGLGLTWDNHGVGSMTISAFGNTNNMIGTAPAAVDANLVAGKLNVLLIWEGINETANNGQDGAAAYAQYQIYYAARKAAALAAGKNLHVTLLTSIPCWYGSTSLPYDQPKIDAHNAALLVLNVLIKTQGVGQVCDSWIDIAANSAFSGAAFTDYALNKFQASPNYDPSDHIHPNDAGHAIIGGIVAANARKWQVKRDATQDTVAPPAFGTYARPFAADSPWNCRPTGVTLGTYAIPPTAYQAYIGGGPYSVIRFRAQPSDPSVRIYGINGPGTGTLFNSDSESYDEFIDIPHFPANVLGAAGADGHADIIDESLNRIYSLYQLTNHSGVWWAQGFSWCSLTGRGWGDPAHYQQGARATGVPTGGGVIPASDTGAGDHFPFALAMSLDRSALNGTAPGYTFPATNADYDYYAGTGQIYEGALLMLPASYPEFPVPSANGVNEKLNKIIRTLKLYGGRVVDRNTDTQFVIYVEGVTSLYIYPNAYDFNIGQQMNSMANALRVATPTGFIDGNGNALQLTKKLNLLSLRQGGGTGYTLETGTTKGVYDTFTQSVTFAANGQFTRMVTGDIQFPYQAVWATPAAGASMTFRVTATGGAKCWLQIFNSLPVFDQRIGDGESRTFAWPSAGVAKRIHFDSGLTGGGTVMATLIED